MCETMDCTYKDTGLDSRFIKKSKFTKKILHVVDKRMVRRRLQGRVYSVIKQDCTCTGIPYIVLTTHTSVTNVTLHETSIL